MTYSVSHVLVLISLIAQAHATPIERLDCIVFHESSYRVEAVGAAGEISLGQQRLWRIDGEREPCYSVGVSGKIQNRVTR